MYKYISGFTSSAVQRQAGKKNQLHTLSDDAIHPFQGANNPNEAALNPCQTPHKYTSFFLLCFISFVFLSSIALFNFDAYINLAALMPREAEEGVATAQDRLSRCRR